MLNNILFIISLFSLFIIGKKRGFFSTEIVIASIFFIYGYSFYLDNKLFGLERISIESLGILHINDLNYTYILLFYTSFLLFYSLGTLTFYNTKPKLNPQVPFISNPKLYKLLLYLFAINFWFIISKIFNLQRLEKIAFLTEHSYLGFTAALGLLATIFVWRRVIAQKKVQIHELLFLFSAIFYGVFEGGREIFIYSGIVFLPEFAKNRRKILPILGGILIIFLLSIWKVLSVYLFSLGDIMLLMEFITNQYSFSFTYLDPAASLLLLNSYLDGASIYDSLRFSYLFNTIGQVLNVFGLIEYESISKRVVEFYNPLVFRKGGGFAFSGILESVLNFSYLGPAILGIILGVLLRINTLINGNTEKKILLNTIFIILMIKLVRTELAVVLKLYVLPFSILILLFKSKLKPIGK